MYEIYYTKQAKKDYQKLKESYLVTKFHELLEIILENPYENPPPYEVLTGDMDGFVSRRLNKQHRLVYQVVEEENAIKVLRMWTHYE